MVADLTCPECGGTITAAKLYGVGLCPACEDAAAERELISVSQVARILEVSVQRVHQMVQEGKLTPAQRTVLGNLFSKAVIETLRAARLEDKGCT